MKKLLITFILGMFLISLISANSLNVNVYTTPEQGFFDKLFSVFTITSPQTNYNIGDIARFTDTVSLGLSYPSIRYDWTITKSGTQVASYSGQIANQGLSISYDAQWNTAGSSAGSYVITSKWYGGQVGQEALRQTNVYTITLLDNTPTPTCTLTSCNNGYQLQNPDSANCYCKQMWTEGNGQCEIGEKESNPNAIDCKTQEQPIIYYRLSNNQCSSVSLLISGKTQDDYLTNIECNSKIVVIQNNTNNNQTLQCTTNSDCSTFALITKQCINNKCVIVENPTFFEKYKIWIYSSVGIIVLIGGFYMLRPKRRKR